LRGIPDQGVDGNRYWICDRHYSGVIYGINFHRQIVLLKIKLQTILNLMPHKITAMFIEADKIVLRKISIHIIHKSYQSFGRIGSDRENIFFIIFLHDIDRIFFKHCSKSTSA
jgi:hypothetical protein